MTAQAGEDLPMDRLKYTLTKGFYLFFLNLRKNFVSILTVATLLFFYLAVFSVNFSASKAIDKLTDIKTIRVFLEEGVSYKDILKELSELQMPASFRYFTKHAAKTRVLNLVPGAKNIEKLPVELFPEFIEMKFADYASDEQLVMETAIQIEQIGGVRTVEYGKSVGEKLGKIKRTSMLFIIFISVITGISSAVIIFNTISLSLYKQQRKLSIYKLVGATGMFIAAPYLFAALLESTLAFLIAGAGNYLFVSGVTNYLLKNSYFMLFTPPAWLFAVFYFLLIITTVFSAFYCVFSFLMRLKSVNEV